MLSFFPPPISPYPFHLSSTSSLFPPYFLSPINSIFISQFRSLIPLIPSFVANSARTYDDFKTVLFNFQLPPTTVQPGKLEIYCHLTSSTTPAQLVCAYPSLFVPVCLEYAKKGKSCWNRILNHPCCFEDSKESEETFFILFLQMINRQPLSSSISPLSPFSTGYNKLWPPETATFLLECQFLHYVPVGG